MESSYLEARVSAGVSMFNASIGAGFEASPTFLRPRPLPLPGRGSLAMDSTINITAPIDVTLQDDTMNVTCTEVIQTKVKSAHSLFRQFHSIVSEQSLDHHVLSVLSELEGLCSDQVATLTNLIKKAPHHTFSDAVQVCDSLTAERNTWRLMSCLYRDRLSVPRGDEDMEVGEDADIVIIDGVNPRTSEKTIINKLFKQDPSIRQCQLMVDWLEQNALEEFDKYYDKVEYFTDVGVAWENTLHCLETKSSGDRAMVTHIDQDASTRQGKPLHDLDQEDEARLLKCLFAYIRCGQREEAQKLCLRIGQPIRAAALEGWMLYNDPNFTNHNNNSVLLPVEGNINRELWRSICWNMTMDSSVSVAERAIFAIYCGNIQALLPMCHKWEDSLWAYVRTLIDHRIDSTLKNNLQHQHTHTVPLNRDYARRTWSLPEVFDELCTRHASDSSLYHDIQKWIMLDDVPALISHTAQHIKTHTDTQPHVLRFVCHLVLVLKAFGKVGLDDECVTIIQTYVQGLIGLEELGLVAWYVSQLPASSQVGVYASFLVNITDPQAREDCLQMATQSGLNTKLITKTVVQLIRRQESEFVFSELSASTSEEDSKLIAAMDWLLYNVGERLETVVQGNAIIRRFLLSNKIDAAKQLFAKIPGDSINVVVGMYGGETADDLPPHVDNTVREYLCIDAYLTAQNSFADWFSKFHLNKPSAPELAPGAKFTEKVAWEHDMKLHKAALQAWEDTLVHYTKVCVESLYNVLMFPGGGWLVDQFPEEEAEDAGGDRRLQMDSLRRHCIPEVVILLDKVHFSMKEYKKCIQLADLVSDDQHQLYKEFDREQLCRLVERVQDAAVTLLDDKDKHQDPLGYPV